MNPELTAKIKSEAEVLQGKINTLAEAEKRGLEATPTTTVQDAQRVVNNNAVTTTDGLRKTLNASGVDTKQATSFASQADFDKFKATLTPTSDKPVRPDLTKEFESLRDRLGVVPLEDKVITLRDERLKLVDKFRSFEKTAGGAETLGVARGRVSEEQKAVQEELDALERRERIAIDSLNLKNSTISNIISLTKEDYNNANTEWNNTFSQNLQLQSAFDSQADREASEARATITTMTSLLKDSGADLTKLDPTTKAQIQSMEIRAGLPAGIFEFANSVAPEDKIQSVGSRTDASGNEFFDMLRIGKDGVPYVQTIARGGGASAGGGTEGSVDVSQYSSIVNSASNLLGAEKSKMARDTINKALSIGDYPTAYSNIANAVEQGLTGDTKEKFANARTDYAILSKMRSAIQKYADDGGNMNILVGTEESIKRKLGIGSGRETELATQLWREFQTYRLNMTGAAFSPAESRDYASVNPTLGKTLNLNLSIIDGALNQLENRVVNTIEPRVPGAKKIYELASGTTDTANIGEVDPSEVPIGAIINIKGQTYRKISEDQYEEI